MTPEAERLAGRLAELGSWSWSRSSGPGGQRRDHAETRAALTLTADDLGGLPDDVARRLREGLGLDRRPLRLSSETDRSRERNRAIVVERLARRIAAVLAPPPPERRPTRPSRAARQRRRADKAHRSAVKAARRPPEAD